MANLVPFSQNCFFSLKEPIINIFRHLKLRMKADDIDLTNLKKKFFQALAKNIFENKKIKFFAAIKKSIFLKNRFSPKYPSRSW